jgi:hypothetical protein
VVEEAEVLTQLQALHLRHQVRHYSLATLHLEMQNFPNNALLKYHHIHQVKKIDNNVLKIEEHYGKLTATMAAERLAGINF